MVAAGAILASQVARSYANHGGGLTSGWWIWLVTVILAVVLRLGLTRYYGPAALATQETVVLISSLQPPLLSGPQPRPQQRGTEGVEIHVPGAPQGVPRARRGGNPIVGRMGSFAHKVVQVMALLFGSFGQLVCRGVYWACWVPGLLIGTQVYVNVQAQAATFLFLAVVWHAWSVFAVYVATWLVLRVCWFQPNRTRADLLVDSVAFGTLIGLLYPGAKACADLHEKCKDQLGFKLSVLSINTARQGVDWFASMVAPVCTSLATVVLDSTIGTWVVCCAVHAQLPWQLAAKVRARKIDAGRGLG